jgi:eukaryotic-like serine/threonine-protein kinase
MTLVVGTRLGPYEILSALGKGGMGEVCRARDTKLGRDVALKLLPDSFTHDPERLARFRREAQVLASLNHPHIGAIYGLDEANGQQFLILELIDGETLADRLKRGALPLDEALAIAKQMAEALEAAHEKGIIHRDLKPANVGLTNDGHVKVLDFGLAKASEAASGAPPDLTNSPTLTSPPMMTGVGMILGTASYMSPEQARGKRVDKRADIWAFGVVLYEILTAERPFEGDTVSDTLIEVATKEPDWDRIPAVPGKNVRRMLRRCLERDPKRRLRDIGDAWELLEEAGQISGLPDAQAKGLRRRLRLSWGLAALFFVMAGALSFIHIRETPPQRTVLRYTIAVPENTNVLLRGFAISPDGRYVAVAARVNGKQQLWLRPLDAVQAQPMPGTDEAGFPFWSPDSRSIGFFDLAKGTLRKIAVSGGPAQALCDATGGGVGGSWNRDDLIVFSSGGSIQRVSAFGGVPADVTATKGFAVSPVFLPDGRRFLYRFGAGSAEQNGVHLASLDGKEDRRVLADNSTVIVAAGYLLFIRESTLMAQPFDAVSGQLMGEVALPVVEGVSLVANGNAPVTASETGMLVYESSGRVAGPNNQMSWYDRGGKLLGAVGAPGGVFEPAISPDEKSIAFRRFRAPLTGAGDLWLRDLTRGAEQRLTTDAFGKFAAFWSPKGDRLVFASARGGGIAQGSRIFSLYQRMIRGNGKDELLLAIGNSKLPTQWSRDGRFIVYSENDPRTKWDIWALPMDGGAERKPVPVLHSEFNELFGQLSPDDQWMAYTSDKTGQREVYVAPFPAGEGETRISITGGEQPRWRGDGKELFFVGADGNMMAVAVKTGVPSGPGNRLAVEPAAPQPLFAVHLPIPGRSSAFEYDVTADGKRFLIDAEVSESVPPLTAVVNWDAGLKK